MSSIVPLSDCEAGSVPHWVGFGFPAKMGLSRIYLFVHPKVTRAALENGVLGCSHRGLPLWRSQVAISSPESP